jgi:hypothetical protein
VNQPWTFEELRKLVPELRREMEAIEAEYEEGEARPVPPLTVEETRDFILRLVDVAQDRALTKQEVLLHGQLICQLEGAVRAKTLGKSGRYYCISEDEFAGVKARFS